LCVGGVKAIKQQTYVVMPRAVSANWRSQHQYGTILGIYLIFLFL